jgi:hypothetical protein
VVPIIMLFMIIETLPLSRNANTDNRNTAPADTVGAPSGCCEWPSPVI